MPRSPRGTARRRLSLWALMLYITGWASLAAVVVVVATALLRDGEDEVTLPPVRETQLTAAAQKAGCVLRSGPGVEGLPQGATATMAPAKPGVYEDDVPPADSMRAARRRGIIVIEYSPSVPQGTVEQLRTIQSAVPRGTILARNRRLEFVISVTAWRRLLGCTRLEDGTFDAIRLFRGRFIGSGPDAG